MISLVKTLVPLIAIMATVVNGDITGTNPSVGSCLCPNTGSLNIRYSPCGDVLAVAGYNECFTYTGTKWTCTTDITYEYFEINYNDGVAWVVGNYLNLEQTGYCTQYPCGVPQPQTAEDSSENRILGGTEAVRDAWPWQLAIEDSNGDLLCGAVLIGSQWALTSAACLADVQFPIRVVAGVFARTDPVLPEQVRLVNQQHVTEHPGFNSTSLENNIALLFLTEAYDLSTSSIRNICLPPDTQTDFYENPNCFMTGWGITSREENATPANNLQRATTDVIIPINCELWAEYLPLPSEVCTFDQVSRSRTPCTGDMGGPLSCAINTRFQLAGIASYTLENCNPRMPAFYTNVPVLVDWIRETTGIE